jgi:hypothetical protein
MITGREQLLSAVITRLRETITAPVKLVVPNNQPFPYVVLPDGKDSFPWEFGDVKSKLITKITLKIGYYTGGSSAGPMPSIELCDQIVDSFNVPLELTDGFYEIEAIPKRGGDDPCSDGAAEFWRGEVVLEAIIGHPV